MLSLAQLSSPPSNLGHLHDIKVRCACTTINNALCRGKTNGICWNMVYYIKIYVSIIVFIIGNKLELYKVVRKRDLRYWQECLSTSLYFPSKVRAMWTFLRLHFFLSALKIQIKLLNELFFEIPLMLLYESPGCSTHPTCLSEWFL